ncbi:hypothetical protein HHI36_018685 [Cryptolaemus montrouzieri]|uniref:Uncharacterized protein n=1 Tax=Cryptolaemus montrouzieri TaxID=559131 RepID=A0ABD2P0N6_9CUCU
MQLELTDREKQIKFLKCQINENTEGTEQRERECHVTEKAMYDKIIQLKRDLVQEEQIKELQQEKLEKQKESIKDQTGHLAFKSYQTEAALTDIENRIYNKLYTKLMDDISQKFTKNTIQPNVNSKSTGKEKIPSGTESPVNVKPQKHPPVIVATGSLDMARKKVIQPGSSPLPQTKAVKNAFSTKPPLHTETEIEKTTHHLNESNDDDWKVVKSKRHNNKLPSLNRPQPLKGTNNEKQHLLKIAWRMSTLFVSGLAPEMDANRLAEYLKEKQL